MTKMTKTGSVPFPETIGLDDLKAGEFGEVVGGFHEGALVQMSYNRGRATLVYTDHTIGDFWSAPFPSKSTVPLRRVKAIEFKVTLA